VTLRHASAVHLQASSGARLLLLLTVGGHTWQRLLLLHGRWSYLRNKEGRVLYSFYKNWAYVLVYLSTCSLLLVSVQSARADHLPADSCALQDVTGPCGSCYKASDQQAVVDADACMHSCLLLVQHGTLMHYAGGDCSHGIWLVLMLCTHCPVCIQASQLCRSSPP